MPLENSQREELSSLYNNLIDFYFKKVKPIVTAAERIDSEQRMVITAAVEIRSAFDHIMRVDGILNNIVDESVVDESKLTIFVYCKKNLDKAHGHLYRAAYDAYDIIAFSVTLTIEELLKKVSQEALYIIEPDAAKKIVIPFNEALDIVTAAKVKKDVDGREAEKVEFDMYEKSCTSLLEIRNILQKLMPALISYDKEIKKKKLIDYIILWSGWIVAFIGTIATIYFGFKALPK